MSSALSSPKTCLGHPPGANLCKVGFGLPDLCLMICNGKATKVKKTHPTQITVYQHCSFTAAILKRSNSSELLYTWLQPLSQTYSQTFSLIVLLSFLQVLQKPGLWCLATQKPKEASMKPANTSHLLTNVIKKAKQITEVVQVSL